MGNKKTHITFKLVSPTAMKVLHDGNHIGNIWSQSNDGGTPFPHDDNESTLQSIQVCGFNRASEIWSCGVFHGTKDIILRFNPMMDEHYKKYHTKYKEYVDECFKKNKPQLIKPFDDWVAHMGYPTRDNIRRMGNDSHHDFCEQEEVSDES